MPDAAAAIAADDQELLEREEEYARNLYAAERAERTRRAVATKAAEPASSAAAGTAFSATKRRLAYHFATKFLGQGVFAETFIAPLIGILLDDLRFLSIHIFRVKRVPWIPVPGLELPDFESWEYLFLIFQNIIILPFLLILNPFVFIPIVVIVLTLS